MNTYDSATKTTDEFVVDPKGNKQRQRTTINSENKTINWEIPILLRYNINNYIGVGAGLQANINILQEQNQSIKIETFEGDSATYIMNTQVADKTLKDSFADLKAGLLFDLTIGAARIGPSLGARYVLNFEQNFNYFQFYGIWKF